MEKDPQQPEIQKPLGTLKEITRCDMHLALPGARQREYFPEPWLETCSQLATHQLAAQNCATTSEAVDRIVASVARDLDIRQLKRWTPAERRGLRNLAPLIAATEPHTWPTAERRALRDLVRAKGGQYEREIRPPPPRPPPLPPRLGEEDKGVGPLQLASSRWERGARAH